MVLEINMLINLHMDLNIASFQSPLVSDVLQGYPRVANSEEEIGLDVLKINESWQAIEVLEGQRFQKSHPGTPGSIGFEAAFTGGC